MRSSEGPGDVELQESVWARAPAISESYLKRIWLKQQVYRLKDPQLVALFCEMAMKCVEPKIRKI